MTRISLLMLALLNAPAFGDEITDADRAIAIQALKLGYILNGDSMVRWGSIDMTGPKPIPEDERVIPLAKEPKKDKRK
jgi:hypothetical protein